MSRQPKRRGGHQGRTTPRSSRSDLVGFTTGLDLEEMAAELAVDVGDVLGYIAEAEALGYVRVDRTVVPNIYYLTMPPVQGRNRAR